MMPAITAIQELVPRTAFPTFQILLLLPFVVRSSPTGFEIVKFGACYNNVTHAHRCAMNSSSCSRTYDENWLKPHEFQRLDSRAPCGCEDTLIGRCSVPNGNTCSHERRACPNEEGKYFQPDGPIFYNDGRTCKCHGLVSHPYTTSISDKDVTHFGGCRGTNTNNVSNSSSIRCSMNSWSCEDDEEWLSPSKLQSLGEEKCLCDRVNVGGCYDPLKIFCAIDADSCEDAATYISPATVIELGAECRLCNTNVLPTDSTDNDDFGDDEYNTNSHSTDKNYFVDYDDFGDDEYNTNSHSTDKDYFDDDDDNGDDTHNTSPKSSDTTDTGDVGNDTYNDGVLKKTQQEPDLNDDVVEKSGSVIVTVLMVISMTCNVVALYVFWKKKSIVGEERNKRESFSHSID